MKKVLIVSFNGIGNAGGVERVSLYIKEILEEAGYAVKVIEMLRFHLPKFDFLFQSIVISFRLFFMKKDLVVANSWQAFLYPADISFSHGTTQGYTEHVSTFKRFSGAGLTAWMEKTAAKRAKRVLAVSVHVKDDLVSLYKINPEKINVLPNCVDEEKYVPSKRITDKKDNIILFCGRLEIRKGLLALKSLSDFLESIDGWQLLIASNVKQNTELFEMNKKTHIVYGLTAEDMPDFYLRGDVLFFPSLYEGFSMATLEALSCGIPVLGTDFVVTDELKPYAFCKDITTIVDNPREIVSEAEKLVSQWKNQKQFIHEIVAAQFGKKIYSTQFLQHIEGTK